MADIDIPQARALAALISSSISELECSLHPPPTSADSTDSSATSTANAFSLRPTLQIVAAAQQLSALVRPPNQALMDAATGYHISTALRIVVEAHVVEIIRALGKPLPKPPSSPESTRTLSLGSLSPASGALHVREIARVNSTDPAKLARVLRLLATYHIFTETAPDTFANNRLSIALDTGADLETLRLRPHDKYDGSSGVAALVALTTDESMHNSLYLSPTLLSKDTAYSYAPLDAPFSHAAWGTEANEKTMFEWLSLPTNHHRLVRFGNAMKGMSGMTPENAILRGFDWTALPTGSVVVDVGGGVGAAALPIVRACPGIKLVIQDTEKVIEEAPKFWQSHLPAAIDEERVSFEVQDFFLPQLVERGRAASVFLLRMIMHNWPDAESHKILSLLRSAIIGREEEETPVKLVIVDSILMYACRGEEAEQSEGDQSDPAGAAASDVAPLPLLPNWGVANALAYKLDIQMLNNHNAGERTLAAFKALLAGAGWRVIAVHAAHQSWMPQIVAVPGPIPAVGPDYSLPAARKVEEEEDTRAIAPPVVIINGEKMTSKPKAELNGAAVPQIIVDPVKTNGKPKSESTSGHILGEKVVEEIKKTRRRSFWRGLKF